MLQFKHESYYVDICLFRHSGAKYSIGFQFLKNKIGSSDSRFNDEYCVFMTCACGEWEHQYADSFEAASLCPSLHLYSPLLTD